MKKTALGLPLVSVKPQVIDRLSIGSSIQELRQETNPTTTQMSENISATVREGLEGEEDGIEAELRSQTSPTATPSFGGRSVIAPACDVLKGKGKDIEAGPP
ncbi:hypothetical protein APHAL10511_008153 [Amanita phalloides]|nr:hypothetical protein APHAL10511_008153 [Amanita phalloides]